MYHHAGGGIQSQRIIEIGRQKNIGDAAFNVEGA